MKFSAAVVLAVAAGAQAYSNVTYTTEVVEVLTTYCPGPTQITHGGKTYTITEATTLTITDCPCTISKPLTTTSYPNSTYVAPTTTVKTTPVGTGAPVTTTKGALPTAGAGKAAAMSGAGLAGVLGLAAFFL